MKKYHFRDELRKRKLNPVLIGKTEMIVRNYLYRRAVLIKVLSGFQSFFAKSCKINQILFPRQYSTSMEISIIQGN